MKTLNELRQDFSEARELARVGDPETVKQAASKVYEIYKHCYEIYSTDLDVDYAEKTKARELSEKTEAVIRRMLANGYRDQMVAEFFGCEGEPAAAGVNDVSAANENWKADLFERYLPATVMITTEEGSGTGFFITDNAYIVTNHHVVYSGNRKSKSIQIVSGDKNHSGAATIISADRTADVALLRLNGAECTPFIPLVKDYGLRAGEDLLLIGNALGAGLAPVAGNVKFPDKGCDIVYCAQTNAGDSGSPLIDRKGRCIGVHKARESEGKNDNRVRGIAYATNANKIKELLRKWQDKHKLSLEVEF